MFHQLCNLYHGYITISLPTFCWWIFRFLPSFCLLQWPSLHLYLVLSNCKNPDLLVSSSSMSRTQSKKNVKTWILKKKVKQWLCLGAVSILQSNWVFPGTVSPPKSQEQWPLSRLLAQHSRHLTTNHCSLNTVIYDDSKGNASSLSC